MKKLACLVTVLGLGVVGCDGDENTPIDAPTDAAPIDCNCIDTPMVDAIDAPPAIDAIDAPLPIDGPAPMVQVVPCTGAQIAAEVSAPGFAFTITPDNMINVGNVVRFTMPDFHSAVSGPPGVPDGVFNVGFNQTVCIRFMSAATIPFYCNPHQFTASIVVQ